MDDVYNSLFEGDDQLESSLMEQIYDEIGLERASAVRIAPPIFIYSLGAFGPIDDCIKCL